MWECVVIYHTKEISKDVATSEEGELFVKEDDPFARDPDEDGAGTYSDPVVKVMEFERDLLGLSPVQNRMREKYSIPDSGVPRAWRC
jgi:hypothetical protein